MSNLKNLIVRGKEIEIDFPGYDGFKLNLAHMAREDLVGLSKKCTTTKWSKSSHQPYEVLDEDKFITAYVKQVVKGWSGFKFKYVAELLVIETEGLDLESELPYTQENAEELLKNSQIFEGFVKGSIEDVQNFTKVK